MPENEIKPFIRGDEITKIKAIDKLKTPMINLLRTYPAYESFGIIETYFDGQLGNTVIDILDKDKLIEIKQNTKPRQYRLTPQGIDFAISMINLEHSEMMKKFTIILTILGTLTLWAGLVQLILVWLI